MELGFSQETLDPLMQPKAALYLRGSTTEQAVHGYSLAAQEQSYKAVLPTEWL